MKILVVDDDPGCLMLVGVTLRQAGHEVVEAHSGRQAAILLDSDAGGVDLLVTDVEMPEMSGLELIRHIRSRPEMRCLPILVCTGSDDAGLAGWMAEYGVGGCLSKPFEAHRLCAEVCRLLGSERSAGS